MALTSSTSAQQPTPSYIIRVTRENGVWLAEVTDLPGVSTWATTFAGLDHNVREAIALAEDLPEGAAAVNWEFPPATSHP